MLHGLIDMIVTCFHIHKIASDGDFYLPLDLASLASLTKTNV